MFANISLGVKSDLKVLSSQEGADNYTLSLCHEIFMSNANMGMIYHGALTKFVDSSVAPHSDPGIFNDINLCGDGDTIKLCNDNNTLDGLGSELVTGKG